MKSCWLPAFLLLHLLPQPAGAGVPPGSRPTLARYWITLRDKNGVHFNPSHYFSPAARARRARQHLPAYEASDLPVRADYVAAIAARVDTVTLVSRWFNAVACRATTAQATALRALPGVVSVAVWPLAEARAPAKFGPARLNPT